jgi:UDP-glucuronate 4-epimerase
MSTYLVTGAAGFIASKVCEMLLADGHTVVGIDNLNDYYDVRLKDYRLGQLLGERSLGIGHNAAASNYARTDIPFCNISGRFTFRYLDIENLDALDRLFAEFAFDAVFNLAARAGVRYSLVNPHVYMSTNAMGTLNLLECQRKYGVNKHVLASTSSLYAGCPMPFEEDFCANQPLSTYAASKKAAELLAHSYHALYGLDVSVLRYFTVVGPAGRPDMALFRFVKWIAEGTPMVLRGDGTQGRDFTHVNDIARGTISSVQLCGYEIFNLGGGVNPIPLTTMISIIEEVMGRRADVHIGPADPVDMTHTFANVQKARRLLGWAPRISAEYSFREASRWYIENAALASVLTVESQ